MNWIFNCILCFFTVSNAFAEGEPPSENFLKATDRIEWIAGGLYDGRFDDGTRFQIQIAYARPSGLPREVMQFAQSYWYPKHLTGNPLALKTGSASGNDLHLALQANPSAPVLENFTVTLTPDKLSGHGAWNSVTLHKNMRFELQRALSYDFVAVIRPAPPEARQNDPTRRFIFAAYFPVLEDAAANAWVRENAGACDNTVECTNTVTVAWKSQKLLSLKADKWGYTYPAAHGNGGSITRHYRIDVGRLSPVEFGAFVDQGPACIGRTTTAIVGRLHARGMAWADDWAKLDPVEPGKGLKFIPTASGIIFPFDPYEVGPYAQGASSMFLTRALLGDCLKNLPMAD